MGVVAVAAVLGDRAMLEGLGAAHRLVAFEALLVAGEQCGFLAAMGVVTTGATHPAFLERVVRRHVEAGRHILVAIHTGGRLFVGRPQGQVEALGRLGRMHTVAVAAIQIGLLMIGEGPGVQRAALTLVTIQALGRIGKQDVLATLGVMEGILNGVAVRTLAMVIVDAMINMTGVAGKAGPGFARFGRFGVLGRNRWHDNEKPCYKQEQFEHRTHEHPLFIYSEND